MIHTVDASSPAPARGSQTLPAIRVTSGGKIHSYVDRAMQALPVCTAPNHARTEELTCAECPRARQGKQCSSLRRVLPLQRQSQWQRSPSGASVVSISAPRSASLQQILLRSPSHFHRDRWTTACPGMRALQRSSAATHATLSGQLSILCVRYQPPLTDAEMCASWIFNDVRMETEMPSSAAGPSTAFVADFAAQSDGIPTRTRSRKRKRKQRADATSGVVGDPEMDMMDEGQDAEGDTLDEFIALC